VCGRSGVANRRSAEGCCVTVIRTRGRKHIAPDSSGLHTRVAGARRAARSTLGGEFRGVGYVEFVDLVVDLVGREAG
jgi:hypothetical protein